MQSKEIKGIQEAYASIYESAPTSPADAVKKVNKKNFPSPKPLEESDHVREQTAADYPLTGGTSRSQQVSDIPTNCKPTRQGKDPSRPIGKGNPEAVKCEETDVFDIIKGYLIDECFAETEEAALAIMSNMSEEWRQSIVEGLFDFLPKSKTVVPGKYGKNTVLSKKDGVEGVSDKTKPGSFTPQKGGWDHMDATRYHSQGGDVSLINRRDPAKNRIK